MPIKSGKTVNCCQCGALVYKTKSQLLNSSNVFCSRKCSCLYGSKKRWKDHVSSVIQIKCSCGTLCDPRNKHGECRQCFEKNQIENSKHITKYELKKKHDARKIKKWYSSEIRNFNRDWNKELTKLPCQNCGYKAHVELAHIKPVADFNDNSTLGEINSPENNLVLCPNCHWEFDNKLLLLENIPIRKNG